jgi:AcrR family transcriptional regulator
MLLDAAIGVLGERGMRALTHRAVDAEAGVAAGSTANYFPTREALLEAIVERVSALERDRFDEVAVTVCPTTPVELGRAIAGWARDATGVYRALTLSRYAIVVEAGHNAKIRHQLAATGSRVNAWFANWLRLIGSRDADHDVHVLGNYLTGLMLHQLAMPDPQFDPTDHITALLESLAGPARAPARNPARRDGTPRAEQHPLSVIRPGPAPGQNTTDR